MKVLFRVDASASIGSGHARRCLTLADALSARGAEVVFCCASIATLPRGLFAERGLTCEIIASPLLARSFPQGWEAQAASAEVQRRDVLACRQALAGQVFDWVIVDHYMLDADWERAWGGSRVLAIDDLASRPHRCDLLLDQTFGRSAESYQALVPEGCRLLLGSQYALLRREFADCRGKALARRLHTAQIRNVLVNFGGTDIGSLTIPAIEELLRLDWLNAIEVVCGSAAPSLARIEELASLEAKVTLHVDVADMAARLSRADLAIGAGGATAWERCALGLPAIIIPVADNQTTLSSNLAETGGALVIDHPSQLRDKIEFLRADMVTWHRMVAISAAICDGAGVPRVCDEMFGVGEASGLVLRRARTEDCERIWIWRNDPLMRRMAHAPEPILLANHERWFAEVVDSPNHLLLIAEVGDEPAGMVRFDLSGGEATVSINLAPQFRGRGLGQDMLASALIQAESMPGIERLVAEVRLENVASRKAFERCGFGLLGENRELLTFGLSLNKATDKSRWQ